MGVGYYLEQSDLSGFIQYRARGLFHSHSGFERA